MIAPISYCSQTTVHYFHIISLECYNLLKITLDAESQYTYSLAPWFFTLILL